MRIAWFSPLPPARSGIATYSADILPRLAAAHAVDTFSDANAGDFVWKARDWVRPTLKGDAKLPAILQPLKIPMQCRQ